MSELIFPNIEMRLDAAAKSGFINIHLLVSPEDLDHVHELGRILSRLTFSAYEDQLRLYARRTDSAWGNARIQHILDERAALREGATQFKVGFAQLREVIYARVTGQSKTSLWRLPAEAW